MARPRRTLTAQNEIQSKGDSTHQSQTERVLDMATIRFPTRIAHATDEEESLRYALQATLVTPDGYAVATDARFAACVKVQVDGLDRPVLVPQQLGPKSKSDIKAEYH